MRYAVIVNLFAVAYFTADMFPFAAAMAKDRRGYVYDLARRRVLYDRRRADEFIAGGRTG